MPEKTFENAAAALKQQIQYSPDDVSHTASMMLAHVFMHA
jgi:hypothetical protein